MSIDGGRNWTTARLDGPSFSKSLHRFYHDFEWDGRELFLQSRAIDDRGNIQPTKDALRLARGENSIYHNNGIQTWHVRQDGSATECGDFMMHNGRCNARKNLSSKRFGALVIALSSCVATHSAWADAAADKALFNQCAGCHAIGPDATHRFGPQLNGLMTRGAGVADGFDYSDAFLSKVSEGLTWDEQTLDAYLSAPMSYMPGTKMAYPGVQSEDERVSIIAYLATINADGTTAGDQAAAVQVVKQEEIPRPLAKDVGLPEHGILHLGRAAMAEEIAAWDIDIRPDGAGLPLGAGSVETGGELYDAQCASCHGVFGEGEGRWPILAGGQDTLTEERPGKTVGSYWPYLSTVFDYARRAMPFGNARSLSDNDVYALTAYLLYLNDIVDESFELSVENFDLISMPNESNFIADNRADEEWFEASVEPCMSDCIAGEVTVLQRARVLDATPEGEEVDGALD